MAEDLVQLMADGTRRAGADLATIAHHLDRIDYLSPSEATSLTAALAHVSQQVERARSRVDAIEGPDE